MNTFALMPPFALPHPPVRGGANTPSEYAARRQHEGVREGSAKLLRTADQATRKAA